MWALKKRRDNILVADIEVHMVADMVADMEEDVVAGVDFIEMVQFRPNLFCLSNFTFLTNFHNFVQISQCSILMRELVTGVG